jgi:Magnesium chelatase, subunit ChlI C-terminal/Magnesium chelatase, subunit ChlI
LLDDYPVCCRHSAAMRRSTSRKPSRSPGCSSPRRRWSRHGRFGPHIIRPRLLAWLAVAASLNRARCRWPIMASCFSMSCSSSLEQPARRSVSRLRMVRSPLSVLLAAHAFPLVSRWWRRRIPVRAATSVISVGPVDAIQQISTRSLPDLYRYARRLSGPLLDRIDLYVQAERVTAEELASSLTGESTAAVQARVCRARAIQQARGADNAQLRAAELLHLCRPTAPARRTLAAAVDRLGLTARGFHRSLRVARTIADLAGDDLVDDNHVREALSMRFVPLSPIDRSGAA